MNNLKWACLRMKSIVSVEAYISFLLLAPALLDQGSRGCGKEITETGNKAPVFQCGHKTFLAFCELKHRLVNIYAIVRKRPFKSHRNTSYQPGNF